MAASVSADKLKLKVEANAAKQHSEFFISWSFTKKLVWSRLTQEVQRLHRLHSLKGAIKVGITTGDTNTLGGSDSTLLRKPRLKALRIRLHTQDSEQEGGVTGGC